MGGSYQSKWRQRVSHSKWVNNWGLVKVIVKLCRAFHDYAPDLPEFDSADPFTGRVWWEIPLELYWTERDWFAGQWIAAGMRYIPGVLVNTFALPGTAGGMDMLDCAIYFFSQADLSALHSWRTDQVESVMAYFQLFDVFLDGEDDCMLVLARIELLRREIRHLEANRASNRPSGN